MSSMNLNYRQCSLLLKHDQSVRDLVSRMDDRGSAVLDTLLEFKNRGLRSRYVHRAIREIASDLTPIQYFVLIGMVVHRRGFTWDSISESSVYFCTVHGIDVFLERRELQKKNAFCNLKLQVADLLKMADSIPDSKSLIDKLV